MVVVVAAGMLITTDDNQPVELPERDNKFCSRELPARISIGGFMTVRAAAIRRKPALPPRGLSQHR